MRRLGRISARSDDMLIVRGVNVFPSQLEVELLKEASLAPHYVIELSRSGALDELAMLVEARDSAVGAVANAAVQRLAQNIKAYVGISAAVRLLPSGSIERSAGKARRVIDKRPR
jgi:phenylacetate-CoA ligase